MKKTISLAVTALAVSLMMTGCSDDEASNTPAPLVEYNAIFVDAAVSGITWSCGDRTGLTNEEGHFGACIVGEAVSFNMGKVSLGTISDTSNFGDSKNTIITPTTLATASGDPEVASKVAIALQSYDSDGDPTNGIQIDAATTTILEEIEEAVDLTDPKVTVASVETKAIETVTIIAEKTGNTKMKPVSKETADLHLKETQKKIDNGEIIPPLYIPSVDTTGATGSN